MTVFHDSVSALGAVGAGAFRHKTEAILIRAVQAARGEQPCFDTESALACRSKVCEWRERCSRAQAEPHEAESADELVAA